MKQPTPAELTERAQRLIKKYSGQWMKIDGVVACGTSLSNAKDPRSVVIKIYLKQMNPRTIRKLPRKVDGIPVVVAKGGTIRAM